MDKKKMDKIISEHMKKIGSKGGKTTAKKFTKKQARALAKLRWDKAKKS